MFCSKCGNEIIDEGLFCSKCGQKVLAREKSDYTLKNCINTVCGVETDLLKTVGRSLLLSAICYLLIFIFGVLGFNGIIGIFLENDLSLFIKTILFYVYTLAVSINFFSLRNRMIEGDVTAALKAINVAKVARYLVFINIIGDIFQLIENPIVFKLTASLEIVVFIVLVFFLSLKIIRPLKPIKLRIDEEMMNLEIQKEENRETTPSKWDSILSSYNMDSELENHDMYDKIAGYGRKQLEEILNAPRGEYRDDVVEVVKYIFVKKYIHKIT